MRLHSQSTLFILVVLLLIPIRLGAADKLIGIHSSQSGINGPAG